MHSPWEKAAEPPLAPVGAAVDRKRVCTPASVAGSSYRNRRCWGQKPSHTPLSEPAEVSAVAQGPLHHLRRLWLPEWEVFVTGMDRRSNGARSWVVDR